MAAARFWSTPHGRLRLVFGLLALLLYAAEMVNGRFWLNDFRVYYGAAQALLAGEPLYGVAHGLDSGVFKYAPLMAVLYVPLALLPYAVAATVQYLLIVVAFMAAMQRADRLVRERLLNGIPNSTSALFLAALVVVVHLHRELHLGNINMLLLLLLLVALDLLLCDRRWAAGLLIGLAVLAKPHFAVLLPLLVLRKELGVLLAAAAAMVAGLLVPMLAIGHTQNMALHAQWLEQMARHNASLIYHGGDGYEAVNTVYSFVYRALLHPLGVEAGTAVVLAVLGLIALCVAALVWTNLRSHRQAEAGITFEYLLLVALVPSITLTDTEHFLLAMPLVLYLVHAALQPRNTAGLGWMIAAVLLAYGGNWEDLLGPLSARYVHHGILGVANVAIIVLSVALYRQRSNPKPPATSKA